MTEALLICGFLLVAGGILVEVLPGFDTYSVKRKTLLLLIVLAGSVIIDKVLK